MILEVDVGNSSLKWRVVDREGGVLGSGRGTHEESGLDTVRSGFADLEAVRFASVAGEEVTDALYRQIFFLWGLKPSVAKTCKKMAGLEIVYEDPSRLGVDRWLAMLAAFHHAKGRVCVVDCGSAITVDLVGEDGRHSGGYIVPGIAMQTEMLVSSTGRIRMESEGDAHCRSWGRSTEQAVNHGILRMVASFIDSVVAEQSSENGGTALYLCGGDAHRLRAVLESPERFSVKEDLVLDGLGIALP
ncbi:MAG: type III pantothenate kinase [Pseudomonadales bacterium]